MLRATERLAFNGEYELGSITLALGTTQKERYVKDRSYCVMMIAESCVVFTHRTRAPNIIASRGCNKVLMTMG